jgi:hypothetical protein
MAAMARRHQGSREPTVRTSVHLVCPGFCVSPAPRRDITGMREAHNNKRRARIGAWSTSQALVVVRQPYRNQFRLLWPPVWDREPLSRKNSGRFRSASSGYLARAILSRNLPWLLPPGTVISKYVLRLFSRSLYTAWFAPQSSASAKRKMLEAASTKSHCSRESLCRFRRRSKNVPR